MRIYTVVFSVSGLFILPLTICLCFSKLTMPWPLGPLGLGKYVLCAGCGCSVRHKLMFNTHVIPERCFWSLADGDTDPI